MLYNCWQNSKMRTRQLERVKCILLYQRYQIRNLGWSHHFLASSSFIIVLCIIIIKNITLVIIHQYEVIHKSQRTMGTWYRKDLNLYHQSPCPHFFLKRFKDECHQLARSVTLDDKGELWKAKTSGVPPNLAAFERTRTIGSRPIREQPDLGKK